MLKFAIVLISVVVSVRSDNPLTAQSQAISFNVADCSGTYYTCITQPNSCTSANCNLVAAWRKVSSNSLEFTIIGKLRDGTGYVTIGFSEGQRMDKMRVIICGYDGQTISMYNAYNNGYSSAALKGILTTAGLTNAFGDYTNGYLNCRFTRSLVADSSPQIAKLDTPLHVSVGAGPFTSPLNHGYHYSTPPVTSTLQDLTAGNIPVTTQAPPSNGPVTAPKTTGEAPATAAATVSNSPQTASPVANNGVPAQNQRVTFSLADCSTGYSCMQEPMGCTDGNCDLIAAWKKLSADSFEFTLIGKLQGSTGYVTIGFNEKSKMDKSRVIICAYDGQKIALYNAYNTGYSSKALGGSLTTVGLTNGFGDFTNGYLSCRFTRPLVADSSPQVARLDSRLHVQVGAGPFTPPLTHRIHYSTPIVSSSQDLTVGSGVIGTQAPASRAFWRAHGCLMIIAWVLIALAATLQPRYYRQMWPNRKLFKLQVWFGLHQPLMIIATVMFTVAFILALYVYEGKFHIPDKQPQSAHPILGLMALILGWANPLIAIFRCDPGSRYRPLFNWVHFFVGNLAIIFAVINCLIGLSFNSVGAPPWTAWVLVAALVFHIVVEIVLEFAGCFYYAKNKENSEEFELRQRGRSDADNQAPELKPDPAGGLFKTVVLIVHSVVMTALVFSIVIGIAVN